MNDLRSLLAHRIGGHHFGEKDDGYKFAAIKAAKVRAQLRHQGTQLLDFGIGEPDIGADEAVCRALAVEALDPRNRGYADNGCVEFLDAVGVFMQKIFGVTLDARTQILHSMGTKSALAILAGTLINPGDVALTTTPGYPVFGNHVRFYGGEEYVLPLLRERQFLPQLDNIPQHILQRAKVLLLNYPNNPTGAVASEVFFREVIAFAKKNNIIILHDAAYAALTFDDCPSLSILTIPGASECTLELHSCSKAFNMTGWRLGWVCGSECLVKAYGFMKNHTDSGQFLAMQRAAIKALEKPEICREAVHRYQRRLKALVEVLTRHGWRAELPRSGFFLYVDAPQFVTDAKGQKTTFQTAQMCSDWLIEHLMISTVPWDEAGRHVRFSATFGAEMSTLAALDERLGQCVFHFA